MMKITPIQHHKGIYIKREDLYSIAGVRGAKARTCWFLAQGANGLVTAGSRQSPQANIVAQIAKNLNIPCHIHTPQGELSEELLDAKNTGAEIIQHKAGYNNVIIARAREDAKTLGWINIPFGMECEEAVNQTSLQVINIPDDVKRIVIPVGSGMNLAGLLNGMKKTQLNIPVIGIMVGANPVKRLNEYAPKGWENTVKLINCDIDYHKNIDGTIGDIILDPVYEAKCLPYLIKDDLFWIIGLRKSIIQKPITDKTTNGIVVLKNETYKEKIKTPLADRFIIPPTSVLNKSHNKWFERSRKWRKLGIESETARPEFLKGFESLTKFEGFSDDRKVCVTWNKASIFDPVLCEVMYSWFCPKSGTILDPFAGGSVRGVVANALGYKYTGIELRKEQVESNIKQANKIFEDNMIPEWICGDSNKILDEDRFKPESYDFIFSCPPYLDLEKYSDLKDDISNMKYDDFMIIYESIIKKSISCLKYNEFACFVVGDVRNFNMGGCYYNFVGDTKNIFIKHGALLWNEAILVTLLGSGRFTARRNMKTKKLVKNHQNVLIFKKYKED